MYFGMRARRADVAAGRGAAACRWRSPRLNTRCSSPRALRSARGVAELARGTAAGARPVGGRGHRPRRGLRRPPARGVADLWAAGLLPSSRGRTARSSTASRCSTRSTWPRGCVVLLVVLVRALLGTYTEHNVVRVRVAAMFWHFVDAVWILMFVSLYLFWNAGRSRALATTARWAPRMTTLARSARPPPRRSRRGRRGGLRRRGRRAPPTRCPSRRTRPTSSPAAWRSAGTTSTSATSRTPGTATRATAHKGDGKGPASYGYRPPPRNFTQGIFKFARMRSQRRRAPTTTTSSASSRAVSTARPMLEWDVPEEELRRILQYIKTFAPKKWEKKKKNGEPVSRRSTPGRPPPTPGTARTPTPSTAGASSTTSRPSA